MKWKIKEIKSAEQFLLEMRGYDNKDDFINDVVEHGERMHPDDMVNIMKLYAEHVLEGTATQAKVSVTGDGIRGELMNFMGVNRHDKGVNVHVSKDSILKLKDKL